MHACVHEWLPRPAATGASSERATNSVELRPARDGVAVLQRLEVAVGALGQELHLAELRLAYGQHHRAAHLQDGGCRRHADRGARAVQRVGQRQRDVARSLDQALARQEVGGDPRPLGVLAQGVELLRRERLARLRPAEVRRRVAVQRGDALLQPHEAGGCVLGGGGLGGLACLHEVELHGLLRQQHGVSEWPAGCRRELQADVLRLCAVCGVACGKELLQGADAAAKLHRDLLRNAEVPVQANRDGDVPVFEHRSGQFQRRRLARRRLLEGLAHAEEVRAPVEPLRVRDRAPAAIASAHEPPDDLHFGHVANRLVAQGHPKLSNGDGVEDRDGQEVLRVAVGHLHLHLLRRAKLHTVCDDVSPLALGDGLELVGVPQSGAPDGQLHLAHEAPLSLLAELRLELAHGPGAGQLDVPVGPILHAGDLQPDVAWGQRLLRLPILLTTGISLAAATHGQQLPAHREELALVADLRLVLPGR
mmetsp:Transcript_124492/g.387628  ORF Transcript_124492/g.387628 Transcript_124492/m.387628 type:complete len:478 (+) Transcript_124492:103-1536(+)